MDIIELAKKVGMVTVFADMGAASCVNSEGCSAVSVSDLEHFAELVAATEREACSMGCRCSNRCQGATALQWRRT